MATLTAMVAVLATIIALKNAGGFVAKPTLTRRNLLARGRPRRDFRLNTSGEDPSFQVKDELLLCTFGSVR